MPELSLNIPMLLVDTPGASIIAVLKGTFLEVEVGEGRRILFLFPQWGKSRGAEVPLVLWEDVAGCQGKRQLLLFMLLSGVKKCSDIHSYTLFIMTFQLVSRLLKFATAPCHDCLSSRDFYICSPFLMHCRSVLDVRYDKFWALIITSTHYELFQETNDQGQRSSLGRFHPPAPAALSHRYHQPLAVK